MKTTSLEIKEVTDPEEILSILLDEEIYERISDDDSPSREDYVFRSMGGKFYGGYVDGRLVGLIAHHGNQIHVNLLKGYRHYKRDLWHGVKERLAPPVYAKIPSLFPAIIEFAKSEGFTLDTVIKDAYKKNGDTYDIHVMVCQWDT